MARSKPDATPALPAPVPALFLLGGIELQGVAGGDGDRLVAQSKVIALLAYLALSPHGRYQRRDRIVGLLWPELDQSHARAALRKAVFAARSSLGDDAILGRGDEELLLVHDRIWCDAVDFTNSADAGHLARALKLYRGDLMPGFHLPECNDFDLWLESERAAAIERAAAAAWALARRLEEDSQFSEAGSMARTAVRYVWSDERVLRRAMLMLQRLGDRAGALHLFDDVARRLRTELDAAPSAETVQLAATIRHA